MKRLLLTGALMLAATAAMAQPEIIELDQNYATCRHLSTILRMEEQETREAMLDVMIKGVVAKECKTAPAGLPIVVRRRLGPYACISSPTDDACAWVTYPRPEGRGPTASGF